MRFSDTLATVKRKLWIGFITSDVVCPGCGDRMTVRHSKSKEFTSVICFCPKCGAPLDIRRYLNEKYDNERKGI